MPVAIGLVLGVRTVKYVVEVHNKILATSSCDHRQMSGQRNSRVREFLPLFAPSAHRGREYPAHRHAQKGVRDIGPIVDILLKLATFALQDRDLAPEPLDQSRPAGLPCSTPLRLRDKTQTRYRRKALPSGGGQGSYGRGSRGL
jgi:hypothetical protein